MPDEVKVIPLVYEHIRWFAGKINKYPRKYKFSIGDRLTNNQLDILELLIEARYQARKRPQALRRANIQLEKLRYLIRLSRDLQCISSREYSFASEKLLEIGKMVGGWEKHSLAGGGGKKV